MQTAPATTTKARPAKARTRGQWAAVINGNWRKSIESIIQTGRDLIAAKAELPNGQFGKMIAEDLDFTPRMAQQLMTIAGHPQIGKANSRSQLPASWRVLFALSELEESDFEWAKQRGLVTKETSLRSATALKGALATPKGETWGKTVQPASLPSPSEARAIARETERFVAASDGNIYSGATEEEGEDMQRRMSQTYKVRDAIELIAQSPSPQDWLAEAETHWLHKFDRKNIGRAVGWLENLSKLMVEN